MRKLSRKKLVVVGDGFCGKTSLLHVFQHNEFPEDYVPTVFENYIAIIHHESGKSIELSLWDTAGQEEYDRLRPLCYPETDVILACFAIDQVQSFENVKDRWIPEMDHFLFNTPRLLVGTKGDLRNNRQRITELNANGQQLISVEQAQALAKKLNTQYIECSAKTNTNIKEVIHTATGLILSHRKNGLKTKICTLL
ncbi:P-loop containing nucleoside triphosphate hydrolase protein [Mycotypha africana]|uniref:P-loop containing nucleoside triphosphate hydrolase protein n=1 Tax=Mycotypha africana TaxID=64632 RepID=UPI002301F7CF|nr:P-loop containing nucleoside triphosphate hydrolase protein [Mycotypha africana]KAI8987334.1 P-loop containing nucleoside triphosphate hydrolase protein [Mycotypha africana]